MSSPATDANPVLATQHSLTGETPALRLFALLELIGGKDHFVTLQGLVDETGLPKATVHRMLQQLETAGLVVRQADGRHYGTGARLRNFAETLMLNTVQFGARHAVLRHLVDQTGETCNITALSGDEVVYLDRVETDAPLRFLLHPGSRVPMHASASGKRILAQLDPDQRQRLLGHVPLQRYTPNTITDLAEFGAELDRIAAQGYAIDNEEYLPGLVCVAVLVPGGRERSNLCVAAQAPVLRVAPDAAAEQLLPPLRKAAEALREIEREGNR
ncbi:IclR family transcriptional regulator [Flexivirga meconopsidis]|uniref:IclR family transcriptional regulator n=1 Tax=Flexivirga meconopsidis TaxID=2977121 RepID=UPI00223FC0A7